MTRTLVFRQSIGFREQAIDLGAALTIPEGESVGGEFEIEYLYGFAPNTHLNIGIDPSIEEDNDETEFSIGATKNLLKLG